MPWKMSDATRFTKKADTPSKKKQFSTVANKVLKESGDEGKAIMVANAAVKNHPSHKRERKRTRSGQKK